MGEAIPSKQAPRTKEREREEKIERTVIYMVYMYTKHAHIESYREREKKTWQESNTHLQLGHDACC